ncbi:hypothetical protein [Aliikangiella sp. G2MR2-5]|uniref:hypothetical protein n=1 Tax=Aliikangiella sp. G2MR2-5 TaxID=2788943 RepID=UPI0018AA47C6|nr:hypothetical protein [Aliikangiella sp. G2MR2-5]
MKNSESRFIHLLKHFGKDLLLLVLGVYLALWMEEKVQDWENDQRQRDYLYRLSEDLDSDIWQMENLLDKLTKKVESIESGLAILQGGDIDISTQEGAEFVLGIGRIVNEYFFFEPQEFTYLSMRESGDFKLIKEDSVKSKLIRHYSHYSILKLLQKNYMQGLDSEFIPLWVRNVDMIKQEIINKELANDVLFKNMVAFAYNETSNRKQFISKVLKQTRLLKSELLLQSKMENDLVASINQS